jgi:hypothetical protein
MSGMNFAITEDNVLIGTFRIFFMVIYSKLCRLKPTFTHHNKDEKARRTSGNGKLYLPSGNL